MRFRRPLSLFGANIAVALAVVSGLVIQAPGHVRAAEPPDVINISSADCAAVDNSVRSISHAVIQDVTPQTYTGNALMPALRITYDGIALVQGKDYSVSYANNVNAGTAQVTVTGAGAYSGSKTVSFKINRAIAADPIATKGLVCNGGVQVGVPATLGCRVLGGSGTSANSYVATAILDSNYMWSDGTFSGRKIPWSIAKAASALSVSSTSVSLTEGGQTQVLTVYYQGEGITVSSSDPGVVTVSRGNGKLYLQPAGAGRATVTVSTISGPNYDSVKTASISVSVAAKSNTPVQTGSYTGWKESGGKYYYYIKGVKQGTKGRGCEIFDGKGWFWLDAVQGGAKTVNKDVFIPYFYSSDPMTASNQGNPHFGKWVHYDAKGSMLKGWRKVNGRQYYFDPVTGEMAHGACFLPSGGKRVSVFDSVTGVYKGSNNGLWWEYWYENGVKQGIQGRGREVMDPYSKAWYWLDSLYNGKKAVSKDVWIPYTYQGRDNIGKLVLYDASGRMVKGWYRSGGKTWYYDTTTGAMAKGWRTIDGKVHYFDPSTGVMK